MKLVFDAESVIYDLMDWPEIVEDIMEDHSKAKNWLKSSAASIRNIADDIAYDPASTCRHFLDDYNIVCEEGEGEAWKYKDKRADKIDAFLPQLERDLLNEIDDRERKQISFRIKETTLDDACCALPETPISEAEQLRAIVESLSFKDWEDLVEANKDSISRQIKNLQYREKVENEARIDENRPAEKEKPEDMKQKIRIVFDAESVLDKVIQDDFCVDEIMNDYTKAKTYLKEEAESRENDVDKYMWDMTNIQPDFIPDSWDEKISKYGDVEEGEGFDDLVDDLRSKLDSGFVDDEGDYSCEVWDSIWESSVWEYKGKKASDFDEILPQLERDLFNELDDKKCKQVSVRIKETTLNDAYDATLNLTHGKLNESQCLCAIVESLSAEACYCYVDWEDLVKEHKDAINRKIKYLRYVQAIKKGIEKENSIDAKFA